MSVGNASAFETDSIKFNSESVAEGKVGRHGYFLGVHSKELSEVHFRNYSFYKA
jgi:hypothetical protein